MQKEKQQQITEQEFNNLLLSLKDISIDKRKETEKNIRLIICEYYQRVRSVYIVKFNNDREHQRSIRIAKAFAFWRVTKNDLKKAYENARKFTQTITDKWEEANSRKDAYDAETFRECAWASRVAAETVNPDWHESVKVAPEAARIAACNGKLDIYKLEFQEQIRIFQKYFDISFIEVANKPRIVNINCIIKP